MSMPLPDPHTHPLAALAARHETLRAVLDWLADRFAEEREADDAIAWEDGEEHDTPQGPAAL